MLADPNVYSPILVPEPLLDHRDGRIRTGDPNDLRHTFGSPGVDAGASLVQVQAWTGHSAIQTTMRYLHTKSRTADAAAGSGIQRRVRSLAARTW